MRHPRATAPSWPEAQASLTGRIYVRSLYLKNSKAAWQSGGVHIRTAAHKPDDRSRWLVNLSTRKHRNTATVAQANKTARIAWAVLARNESYRP